MNNTITTISLPPTELNTLHDLLRAISRTPDLRERCAALVGYPDETFGNILGRIREKAGVKP